jgi:hypothetical protein
LKGDEYTPKARLWGNRKSLKGNREKERRCLLRGRGKLKGESAEKAIKAFGGTWEVQRGCT